MAARCFACELPIYERQLVKLNQNTWHNNCVKCCECQNVLMEKCYTNDMKLYCRKDYFRLFGASCASCKEGIAPDQYVRKQDSRIFHIGCLKCQQCQKEAGTGDQLHVVGEGLYLCKKDFQQMKNAPKKIPRDEKISDHESDIDEKSPSSTSVNGDAMNSDDEDDINKRRGPRTTIKAKQLEVLKSAFLATPKPSRHIREKLAQDTGLSMRVIQVWFQNRRSKERRVKQLSVQDARRALQRTKLDSTPINELDFRFYQTDETQQPVHAGFNKLEHHQFNEFMQRNPVSTSLPYQPSISQEEFLLNNEFLSDNNNSEMNLIDSFNSPDVNNNQSLGGTINQGLLPSYENL